MINFKAKTLEMAMQQASGQDSNSTFIEIGCIREDHEVPSDGYSTVHIARYCAERGIFFRSIDTNEHNVKTARAALRKEISSDPDTDELVDLYDGEEWLKSCSPIDFLYLDSHREPEYSLKQFMAATLNPGAVVAIDDAHSYDGHQYGKATDLVKLFDAEGINWKLIPTHPGFKMVIAKLPNGWNI